MRNVTTTRTQAYISGDEHHLVLRVYFDSFQPFRFFVAYT